MSRAGYGLQEITTVYWLKQAAGEFEVHDFGGHIDLDVAIKQATAKAKIKPRHWIIAKHEVRIFGLMEKTVHVDEL